MNRKTTKKSAAKITLTAAAALLAAGTTFGALFGEAPTIPQEETPVVSLERTASAPVETLSDELTAELPEIEKSYVPEPDYVETLTVPETPAEPEPVIETIPVTEPVVEIPAEPAVEPIPEPVTVPEPEPIAEPEPVPEPIPEPVVETPAELIPSPQWDIIPATPHAAETPIVYEEELPITENEYENYVWIPKSGSKYHSSSSCSNMKNPSKVTISEAISKGYGACSKCH